MPSPKPPVALKGHCSIIHDNKLYTYQVDAFQSLELKEGAEWAQLPMGVATNGSTCVSGNVDGQDSLFVVGGATKSDDNYSGLQKYTYKTGKWEGLTPVVQVTKNRLGHGTAFLASSSQILIYSGSQDNNVGDSTQTFLVSLVSPFNVLALRSSAPPVIRPLMMPYNASHALMLGGESTNTALYTFGPNDGWKKLPVSLSDPPPDSSQLQATLLRQDDGGKVLEMFNVQSSPNKISTLLLQNSTSTSISLPAIVRTSPNSKNPSQSSRKRKRQDSSQADRPAYNSTLAPQDSRVGSSLASNDDGLVVLSGGGDGSQDVLAMFNETSNQWVDTSTFFGTKEVSTMPSPASSLPSSTAAPAVTASASAAPLPGTSGNNRNRVLTILGATLGAVFGFAAILVLMLLLLKHIRRKRERERRRGSGNYDLDSKRSMDFADRGSPDMISDGGRSHHQHKASDVSGHSDYVMGARRAPSAQSKRSLFHKPTKSDGSAKPFFGRSKSPKSGPSPPIISRPFPISSSPPPQLAPIATSSPFRPPQPVAQPRNEPGRTDVGTNGGWSKYWANGSSSAISPNPTPIGIGSGVPREASTYTSSTSAYTSSNIPSSGALHSSAEVDPLNIPAQVPSPPPMNPARSAGTVAPLSAANASNPPPGGEMPWPPPFTRTLTPGPFPGYPSNVRPMSPTKGDMDPTSLQPGLAVTSDSPPHHQPNYQANQPPSPTSFVSDLVSRPSSPSSSEHGDDDNDDSNRYRTFGRSAPPSWTPIEPTPGNNSFLSDRYHDRDHHRPVSSVYSKNHDSEYYAHPGEKVRIPNFPGVPSRGPSVRSGNGGGGGVSRGPSKGHAPLAGIEEGDVGMRTAASRDFGVGDDREVIRTGEVRRGVGSVGAGGVNNNHHHDAGEDMSWLNLGR